MRSAIVSISGGRHERASTSTRVLLDETDLAPRRAAMHTALLPSLLCLSSRSKLSVCTCPAFRTINRQYSIACCRKRERQCTRPAVHVRAQRGRSNRPPRTGGRASKLPLLGQPRCGRSMQMEIHSNTTQTIVVESILVSARGAVSLFAGASARVRPPPRVRPLACAGRLSRDARSGCHNDLPPASLLLLQLPDAPDGRVRDGGVSALQ